MQFLTITAIASLSAVAAASPLARSSADAYTLYVDSSDTPVKDSCINANQGLFWNQRSTSVGCPDTFNCSGFPNITTVGFANQEAYMAANVPGGQDVYVAADGALSFTEPHEEGVYPKGSFLKTFAVVQDFLDFSGGNAKGWALCGSQGQLYALVENNGCEAPVNKISLKVKPYNGLGAFQFE